MPWEKNYVPQRDSICEEERDGLARGIPWLMEEAAGMLPGETTCFARAIAAQAILRRAGVATTMYYGAATTPGSGLGAHVWLQRGEKGIIGHETAHCYKILARYPDENAGAPG